MYKSLRRFSNNPFNSVKKNLNAGGVSGQYYSLAALQDKRLERLPYSLGNFVFDQCIASVGTYHLFLLILYDGKKI